MHRDQSTAAGENAVLAGITRILRESVSCESEAELATVCLAVSMELTRSRFGVLAVAADPAQPPEPLVIDDPEGLVGASLPSTAGDLLRRLGEPATTAWRLAAQSVRGRCLDATATGGERKGIGQGPVSAFLCVPLVQDGRAVGMIGLGSGRDECGQGDLEVMERVAEAVLPVLAGKRAEAEADRRKDEFLATLAHELRNPLAPIRHAVEVLRLQGAPDPRLADACAIIERQVGHMVRLIDDLLDVARITRGKLTLRREPVGLDTVLQRAIEVARPQIDEAGHAFSVTLPPAVVRLDADPARLVQVFTNLLNNASRFTPRGGQIALRAEMDADGVVVRIEDSGIGIARDQLHRVFDLFSQLRPEAGQAESGLGIGLSLATQLVALHGGRIDADSAGEGQGSTFRVWLPVDTSAGKLMTDGDAVVTGVTQPPIRILVADDTPDVAESLTLLLRLHGHDVQTVHDGRAAVVAAERFRPDLVLLDLGMPELDGCGACRRIRALPDGARPLIVAMTGWGHDAGRRGTEQAGFDGHLVKPVSLPTLLEWLGRVRPGGD